MPTAKIQSDTVEYAYLTDMQVLSRTSGMGGGDAKASMPVHPGVWFAMEAEPVNIC